MSTPANPLAGATGSNNPGAASERLIHALDFATLDEALAQVRRLAGVVTRYKVGLELFAAEGPRAVEAVAEAGGRVFLDLKLHDIPETTRRAARAAASTGAELLTVHAAGGRAMLEAAVAGAEEGGDDTKILAVTVLTSLDVKDLEVEGFPGTVEGLVLSRARLADAAGCHGVIASPKEARAIRAACRPGFLVITPGVRPAASGEAARGEKGSEKGSPRTSGERSGDDQARVGTARQAIADGADAVVVGRPIRDARDPVAAARAFLAELS